MAEVHVKLTELEPVKAALAELTARAERAEDAIQRVRARCAERAALDCTYIRMADLLAALDSTDPPLDAQRPEERSDEEES